MMRFFIIFYMLLSPIVLWGQKDTSHLKYNYFSAEYKYGIIYAHHQDFKYFIKDYIRGSELNYGFRTRGEKTWQRIYHYPEIGIGYSFVDFGNPNVLGNAHALFTFVNLPFIEHKNIIFTAKFAVGLAYLNKIFDLYENKYNIAIGSHVNSYLNINLNYRFKIYKQLLLTGGLGLTHYSNGSTTKPNRGINIFLPSLGLNYQLQKQNFIKPDQSIPTFIKNYELSIIYAAGFTSLEPANPKKYLSSALTFNFEHQFSLKGRWGGGIDFFYDASIPEYDNITDSVINYSFSGKTSSGIHLSYDFVFGKTSFTIQFGGYFYKGNQFDEYVYHRFGLKYRFAEQWIAKLTLKTFWAKAQFPEFGLGYRIKW